MNVSILVSLLRDPQRVADRCRQEGDLRELAVTALGCVFAGGLVFGAVIGSFRGDLQILYAALKLPFAFVATLVVATPAFYGLARAFGRSAPMRSAMALALSAAARGSLVLLAAAPFLWLWIDLGAGYHAAALAAASIYAVSGLFALAMLLRGLGRGSGQIAVALSFVVVFLAVAGQMAWSLRPYFGRPAQEVVPFLRAREGSFADALQRTAFSSVGIFPRDPRARLVDIPAPRTPRHRGQAHCRGRTRSRRADYRSRRAARARRISLRDDGGAPGSRSGNTAARGRRRA